MLRLNLEDLLSKGFSDHNPFLFYFPEKIRDLRNVDFQEYFEEGPEKMCKFFRKILREPFDQKSIFSKKNQKGPSN